MKRNLFAIFLAVMVVAALMLVVAPSAKAEENDLIIANNDNQEITVSENGKTLNLNGKKNVVLKLENDITLSVIDTVNTELDASTAGSLTVSGAGTIAPVAFDGNYRYLAVEENGTYSFHPFNLTISAVGINTIGEDICLRASFFANDVAKALATDWGIEKLTGQTQAAIPAKERYSFGEKNAFHAYMDLDGSLTEEMLDVTNEFKAYIVINGVKVVSNYTAEITPRQVLKDINSKTDVTPTESQITAIGSLVEKYTYLTDLFTRINGGTCSHSAMAAATCVAQGVCKNCDAVTAEAIGLLTGHKDADGNDICDNEGCGSIVTTSGKYAYELLNNGAASNTWEISGVMKRPTGGIDQWNFGFDIYDENGKGLIFSATSGGIVFERIQGQYTRYPFHMYKSQYNIDTTYAGFHQQSNTSDTLYFKAIIKDDVFYAWFGYTEEAMVLSWYIPLSEELVGNPGSTDWKSFSDSGSNNQAIPFPGFEVGSTYQVGMHINSTPAASGSINNMVVKTGADADTACVPKFVTTSTSNVTDVDNVAGSFTSVATKLGNVALAGSAKAWEISGKIDRSDANDQLSLGFLIQSGGKALKVSAVTRGPMFESTSSHGYTGSHAIAEYGTTTQYNFNPDIGYFLEKRTESTMYFKAMIANDMFYVWFGFSEDALKLSWVIPLTEELVATPGYTFNEVGPFTGFEADSSYQVSLYVRSTASATTYGTFSNLTVKTGFEAPKYVASSITNGTVDSTTGNITSAATQVTDIDFAGSSQTWELSGKMDLTTSGARSFMFNIYSGTKSLNLTAATDGIVFGEDSTASGYSRDPFHAFGTTQYNLRPISEFVKTGTQKTLYFKAMIANDVFYVWYWYEGQEPVLSWKVPLAEELQGPNGGAWYGGSPFMGFDPGSFYRLNLRIRKNGSDCVISDIVVKTGALADTSWVDALNATPAA